MLFVFGELFIVVLLVLIVVLVMVLLTLFFVSSLVSRFLPSKCAIV